MMGQSRWQLWAVVAAIGLLAYGAFSLRGAMQPYVTFDQAKRLTGTVRVAVFVNHQTRRYDHETGAMEFMATDTKGNRCLVRLNPKFVPPGGFEQTPMAVVIGRYRDNVFEADRLFIKCPSKYEGHPETSNAGPRAQDGRG